MELKELQRNWNAFGETDPLFAILTYPSKRGNRWDEGEFFQNGVDEINGVMKYVASLGLAVRSQGEALDFGCGVGRLTQALCRHFKRAAGVDIAPSMIKLANGYNKYGERCRYYLNEVNDLSLFESGRFDFIYSFVVLQHMRPEYAKNYVKEFLRILAPGGLAVFQIPSVPGTRNTLAKPMAETGYKARIIPLEVPSLATPGELMTVRVRIKNESPDTWPSTWSHDGLYAVTLGNHWLNVAGGVLVNDDGRTGLPKDMKPGDEIELGLNVIAPAAPGRYVLELDMVQENVSWFGNRGSVTERFEVTVRPPRRRLSEIFRKAAAPAPPAAAPATDGAPAPKMEMYGIEQSEVVELITQHGGKVIDVKHEAASDWLHARYCVTK